MNRRKIKATTFKRAKKLSFLCSKHTDSKKFVYFHWLAKNEFFSCHIHNYVKQQNITTVIHRIGSSAYSS